MLLIEVKDSGLNLGKNKDQLREDCLIELARTEPKNLESTLSEGKEVMVVIVEKLIQMKEKLDNLKEQINDRF